MLRSDDKLNTKAIYAAPFFNSHSTSPEDGMERSYNEVLKIVSLCGRDDLVPNIFKGSRTYLPDETTPVHSPAAEDLAKRAMEYSKENPLYVVAIGAITNVASALLINPDGTYTERSQKILAHTPMNRFGTADDLTGTLLWLCDNGASGFVNGVVVPVDGGFAAYSGV
jgi:hypothetical protein